VPADSIEAHAESAVVTPSLHAVRHAVDCLQATVRSSARTNECSFLQTRTGLFDCPEEIVDERSFTALQKSRFFAGPMTIQPQPPSISTERLLLANENEIRNSILSLALNKGAQDYLLKELKTQLYDFKSSGQRGLEMAQEIIHGDEAAYPLQEQLFDPWVENQLQQMQK
jgi:hypothetical protein